FGMLEQAKVVDGARGRSEPETIARDRRLRRGRCPENQEGGKDDPHPHHESSDPESLIPHRESLIVNPGSRSLISIRDPRSSIPDQDPRSGSPIRDQGFRIRDSPPPPQSCNTPPSGRGPLR